MDTLEYGSRSSQVIFEVLQISITSIPITFTRNPRSSFPLN